MTSRALIATLLVLPALLGACSKPESNARSFSFKEVNGVQEATAVVDGVHFEFDPSVEVHFGMEVAGVQVSNDGDASSVWTVAGQPYGIEEGELIVGPAHYGEVQPGDRVRISADAVEVNGELRGPLP